jgi:hypothetical protein
MMSTLLEECLTYDIKTLEIVQYPYFTPIHESPYYKVFSRSLGLLVVG